MRILVLTPDVFGYGGIARYTNDLLTALASHPKCTEVVVLPRLVGKIAREELPGTVRLHLEAANGKLRYGAALMRLLATDRDYDVIVCVHLHLLPLAAALHAVLGVPIVQILHGVEAWEDRGRPFVRTSARRICAVAPVSSITYDRFRSWADVGGAKEYVLPNAIRSELYGPGDKPKYLVRQYCVEGRKVILTVGRLDSFERYKGFDEVLEVMPALLAKRDDIVYLIGGDGPDRARLEQKVASLGIADRVVFTGYVDQAVLADHYRLADAYVMPSSGEGFGRVILEALACGIPVVASTRDGTREACLDGKMGLLVDPEDRVGLVQAILQALERPRGHVPPELEYFSFTNFERRCHEILNSVLKSSGTLSCASDPASCGSVATADEPAITAQPKGR